MAKLTDDQLRFIIDLDAKGAQGEINSLEAEMSKLEAQNSKLKKSLQDVNAVLTKQEKQLKKMEEAGLQYTEAYKNLSASIEQNKKKQSEWKEELVRNQNIIDKNSDKMAQLTSSLKANEMSMRQLKRRAAELRQQLDVTSKSASPETYRKLQKELRETEAAMGELTAKQNLFSKGIGTLIKGNLYTKAISSIFSGLVSAVKSAFNTIVDFEQENANLASVLGTTQKGVELLTEDAKRLGASTQYTASQITQLQTELAKLGFTQQEILQSTEAVQAFATATGASLPDAASLAGAALRAFGLDASEMERVVSTMGVATSKSALDFSYLQNSMSTIAPVAKSFGFSIEDTTALLGTLANSGFDASSAATATRNILLNLANTSGKLSKQLGKPVRSLDELIPALKNLKDSGIDLAQALELTDQRSVSAFSTFLDNTDTIADLREQITGVSEDLHKMEAERLKTVQGSLQLLSSAWNGLMLSFSNSKGPIAAVISSLTSLIDKLNEIAKGDAERKTELQIMLGENYDEYKQFSEMTYEEAEKFHNRLLDEEEGFVTERQRLIDNLSDRDDEDSKRKRAYYSLQISQIGVYAEERKKRLDQIAADEKAADEKAKEEAAEAAKKAAADAKAAKEAADAEAAKARQERFKKDMDAINSQTQQLLMEESKRYLNGNGKITREEYEQKQEEITADSYEKQFALAKRYGIDVEKYEKQSLDYRLRQKQKADSETVKAEQKRQQDTLAAAKKARQEMLSLIGDEEKKALALLETRYKEGTISTQEYEQQRKDITVKYANLRLQAEQTFYTAVKGLNQDIVADASKAVTVAQQTVNEAVAANVDQLKNNIHDLAGAMKDVADLMGDTLGGEVLESLSKATDAVDKFMQESEHTVSDYVNMIGSVLQGAVKSVEQIVTASFEAETAALEAEKQKQLSIAGDNADERERIENEFAQKELDLKKREADANAAIQTANLWISTATGITGAWATSIAQLGPIAGSVVAGIMTGLLLTTAGIQQTAILKQRDAIKNTTLQSSSGASGSASTGISAVLKPEFATDTARSATTGETGAQRSANSKTFADGGYTGEGGRLQPAGIVHKGEYVVAQPEMRNPSVVPMVRAIEHIRRQRVGIYSADNGGTLRTAMASRAAFADGGYTGYNLASADQLVALVKDLADEVQEIKRTPLRASVNYQELEHADRVMNAVRLKAKK